MKLPWSFDKLKNLRLFKVKLMKAILERRRVIRHHRDQKGDDRCWLDDYLIWVMLSDSPAEPVKLPTDEEMAKLCEDFFLFRSAEHADPVTPNHLWNDRGVEDNKLKFQNAKNLLDELFRIQGTIKAHRDIGNRIRTIEDDRRLYQVLPEGVSADFRLPPEEEFLGIAKSPCAGCPSFHRSHDKCPPDKSCNLHKWGPCS